jgi:hypothetical protein
MDIYIVARPEGGFDTRRGTFRSRQAIGNGSDSQAKLIYEVTFPFPLNELLLSPPLCARKIEES